MGKDVTKVETISFVDSVHCLDVLDSIRHNLAKDYMSETNREFKELGDKVIRVMTKILNDMNGDFPASLEHSHGDASLSYTDVSNMIRDATTDLRHEVDSFEGRVRGIVNEHRLAGHRLDYK